VAVGLDELTHHHGDPDARRIADSLVEEAGRSNADNGKESLLDLNAFSEHRGIETESFVPVRVADDYIRIAAWRLFIFQSEGAPDKRLDPQRGEVIAGHQPGAHFLERAPFD